MNKNNENKLVPRLRFPEFENAGEWEVKRLGEICEINNGKANAQDHIENGRYPLFDRSEVIKASNEFIFDTEAVIIPGEGMRFIPKYYKGKFNLHQRAYALNNFKCFGNFIYYSILNKSTILSHKAVQSTVLSLRLPILQNLNIELPKSLLEQQKIASCLSSLDEVITAESQKLELLKEHKKGLLQNLFPNSLNCDSQGLNDEHDFSKVPKLRFPEFKDAGEWEVKRLGEVATFVNEKTQLENLSINSYISTENLLPDYAGVILASKLPSSGNFTKYQKGDVLVSNIRPYLKKVWFAEKDGGCSNDVIVIRSNSFILDVFLSLLLRNDAFISYIMKSAEGVKMPRGDKDSIKDYPITFPREKTEQQKIAACLSSLDDLINAQRQKIELLKQHKKGLLQGLFPQINN